VTTRIVDAARPGSRSWATAASPPVLDIVVPVHNEETTLDRSVRRLHRYLCDSFPLAWRVTIADSGSTDATWDIATSLQRSLPGLRLVRVREKGRGRALRSAWLSSDATVLAYMDVDLSTDLAALLPLVAPLVSGHSDLAIGTRLARGSRVVRGPKREVISRGYNTILRTALGARFSDAQCGFKAIRRDRAAAILPAVRDQGWFFDTELLVLAQRAGLRIHEVPVDWVDDPHSSVDLAATARADLRGVARLLRGPRLAREVSQFAAVGVASTLAYVAIYLVLRGELDAVNANATALALTAIGNTAANRRFTFGITRRDGRLRDMVGGAGVFVLTLALGTGGLALLHAVTPHPQRWVEVAWLLAATAGASAARFLLLRHWVFRDAIAVRVPGG
jgi:putative flippase GtrA